MARENKTRFALLGLLSWYPMSGYDMKQVIEKSLRHFWQESYGQIYPILTQLEAEGLVAKSVEHHDGKPDRHLYALTPAGQAELQAWLARPAETSKVRMEVLLKVIYGGEVPLEISLDHLHRFREEQLALLDEYREIEAHLEQLSRERPNARFALATVRCGLWMSRAFVHWCEETLADFGHPVDAGGTLEEVLAEAGMRQ